MSLELAWYILYVVIIAGYAILDGFDLGVGMLSLFVARTDTERRLILNSIGPVWDGNEVWLVLGGGALFAAFPLVYASLFSGFYTAMMLVLLVLILRTVAIEFRSKRESKRWRSFWDWVFALSSFGITILLGVALGNVIRGVALDQDGVMNVSLAGLLNPFSLAVAATGAAMFALHGGIFLGQKVEGALLDRISALVPRLMVTFFVLMTGLIGWTLLRDETFAQNYRDRPWIAVFPLLALAAALLAWRQIRRNSYFIAFLASATMIAALLCAVAAGLYPVMIPSATDAAFSLTVQNASAADETLMIMLIFAIIGMPFVLLYTGGVYYFFRGRVRLDDESY